MRPADKRFVAAARKIAKDNSVDNDDASIIGYAFSCYHLALKHGWKSKRRARAHAINVFRLACHLVQYQNKA